MWRRNILHKKREEVKNSLQERLFLLDDTFRDIVLFHRNKCQDMEKSQRLIDLNQYGRESFLITEFKENQEKRRSAVQEAIQKASDECRQKFKGGIESILAALRKKINEANDEEET